VTRRGPIEDYAWPDRLRGHVVTLGPSPRMHGYAVERDVAQHYRFSDATLLALTGELPTEGQSHAFDVALTFLAPLPVSEAPTHAAALARICGSRPSAVLATAAIGLAERARALVAASAGLLAWLAAPDEAGAPPAAADDADRESLEALRAALAARAIAIEALARPLSRADALIATLFFAGLKTPEQIETALVMASLPCVVAEAYSHGVTSFREYPMQLPPFEYEDP
jgi:hypothetical protein